MAGGFRTGFPFGFVGEIDIFQFRRVPGVVDALLELGGQFTLFGDSTENRFLAFGYIAQLIVSLLDLLYLNFIQSTRSFFTVTADEWYSGTFTQKMKGAGDLSFRYA